jgi:hypothetical protein
MEDGNQPEYAFAGGERDNSIILIFDLSFQRKSGLYTLDVTSSALSMTLSLSFCGSTALGLEELKRAEMRGRA